MTSTEINLGAVVYLPPGAFEPMEQQPRSEFDESFIADELAPNIARMKSESLGMGGTGIDEPIKATIPLGALDENGHLKPGFKLPIYSGETRWRAANYLNERCDGTIPLVPAIIQDLSPDAAFEMAYFANAHRRDISAYDEGRTFLRIKRTRNIPDNAKLARYVNKSYEYVRNRIEAVGDEEVAEILIDRPEAVLMARRIAAVQDDEFKTYLVGLAKGGAPKEDISDEIAARKAGVSVKKLRAQRQIDKLEADNRAFIKSQQPSAWQPSVSDTGAATPEGDKSETAPPEKDWAFLTRAFTSILKQSYEIEASVLSDDVPPALQDDLRDYAAELAKVSQSITRSLAKQPAEAS